MNSKSRIFFYISATMIQQTHQDKEEILLPNKRINEKRFFHFFSSVSVKNHGKSWMKKD